MRSGVRTMPPATGFTLRLRRLLASRIGAALPLIAPAQLLVLSLLVIPGLYVLWLSLHASTFGMAPRFVGLANYQHVLGDSYFWRALRNTLVIVVVVVHV